MVGRCVHTILNCLYGKKGDSMSAMGNRCTCRFEEVNGKV